MRRGRSCAALRPAGDKDIECRVRLTMDFGIIVMEKF